MVRLTCLLRRKTGSAPRNFTSTGAPCTDPSSPLGERKPCAAYEQHPSATSSYGAVDDGGYDGADHAVVSTRMASYDAHMAKPDFPAIWDDISTFLDLDRLEFVVTASLCRVSTARRSDRDVSP